MDINNPGVNTFLEGNGENHFTCKIGKTELSGLLGMNMFNCGAHAGCMNKINAANSTWMPCGPIEAFIDKPFLTLDGGSAPVCFASLGEVFRSWAERTLGPAEYFVFEMNYKPGESSVCDGTLIAKLNVDTRPSNLKAKNN
jgi:hypothetical protein